MMTFLRFIVAALAIASVSAISIEKKEDNNLQETMENAISKCEENDKDCKYLAFRVYASYFPTSEFVSDIIEIQEVMREMIGACEETDKDCGALKAYAFSKVFPDSKDAAKEDAGLDLDNEENKQFVEQIENCMEENPLCQHLVISEFCNEDSDKDEKCQNINKLNAQFGELIKQCEGKMGKFCKKEAQKTACKLFPATCEKSWLTKMTERADALKKKMAERIARVGRRAEQIAMRVAIHSCSTNDKDCAYLAFKTYRHYFPDSAFVKKMEAMEDSVTGAISKCESEDADCDALKAWAFERVFPTSEDAEEKSSGLDLSKEDNKKFADEISECISSNPLCSHIIIAEFCAKDEDEPHCAATSALDTKFENMIEKCEGDLNDFCKNLSKKGACKFFSEGC
jgi:hypothetical protein